MSILGKMRPKVRKSIVFHFEKGYVGKTYKTVRHATDAWTAHSLLRIAIIYDNRHDLRTREKNHERFFNTRDYKKIWERHHRRAMIIFKKMLEE